MGPRRFTFEIETLTVPNNVELRGRNRLVWDPIDGPCHTIRPSKIILLEFVDLADAAGERVQEFAQKWGMLELCEHGKPATHNWIYAPPSVSSQFLNQEEKLWCYPTGVEPVDSWCSYARECRTMLLIAAQLHGSEPTSRENWKDLYDRLDTTGAIIDLPSVLSDHLSSPMFSEAQPFALSEFVNRWLQLGDVRPSFVWEDLSKPPHITFGTPSIGKLFAALAIQLMVAISGSDGPIICSSCAKPYFPDRRPRSGEAHYCRSRLCARKAALRDAAKRYRENKKLPPSERQYRQQHRKQKRRRGSERAARRRG